MYTHVKNKIRRYAVWSDIFQECEHKTFDDTNKKASKNNYVKKENRSDHKWAFTFQEMMRVVKMFFDVFIEELVQGKTVYTPLGTFSIKRLYTDRKISKGKKYNQLNVMNYSFWLFCVGNRFKNRSITRVIFGDYIKTLYKRIEKDTSLIYKYEEQ